MGMRARQRRNEAYNAGYEQVCLSLPASLIRRLDALKTSYRLPSRAAVADDMIRRAAATIASNEYGLPPLLAVDDPLTRITLLLHGEHAAYLRIVSYHLRDALLGVAFEAIAQRVHDRSDPAECP